MRLCVKRFRGFKMSSEENKKSIEDKLTTIKYNCCRKPHLKVNQDLCRNCESRCCTHICPAKVYSYNEDTNEIEVEDENCLECGACRIACPLNAIDWEYPKGDYGVIYKNS